MIPGAVGGRAEAGAGDPGAGAEAGEVGATAGGAGVNPHPGNQGYYLIFVFLLLRWDFKTLNPTKTQTRA